MKQLTDAEKASFGWLEKLCEAHMYADRLGPICDYLKSTLDTAQPEPVVRYQFICSNGCGECGVKIFEFEYSRTESLSGELIDSKTYPQIVSTCCNSEVGIWDTMRDDVTGYTVSSKQPERAPLSCTWTQEDDFDMPGVYHTSCGEMWSFTEGGIKENNTKFCPHCGGGIKQGGQQ